MSAPAPSMVVVAELSTPMARAQLATFAFDGPTDSTFCREDAYYLDLCATPRVGNARARYLDRWGPHRFERIGPVFMAAPGEPLQFRNDGGRQASIICELRREPLSELLGQEVAWTDRQLCAGLDISDGAIRSLLRRLGEEMRQPGLASGLMSELIIGQIAIELGRYCVAAEATPPTGGLGAWRLRLIDERLRELRPAPTLTELARLCNLSVRQLTRGFRASRGCSIGDYIARTQIDAAKRLLETDESIKAIARTMGFASASGFSYAFRRGAGVSPRQFRARAVRRS